MMIPINKQMYPTLKRMTAARMTLPINNSEIFFKEVWSKAKANSCTVDSAKSDTPLVALT